MDNLPLWISRHVLGLWAGVLVLALLVADFAWRRARRSRLAATGRDGYLALRLDTATTLLVLFAALFLLLAWAVWTRTALVEFDMALAQALHDGLTRNLLQVVAVVTHAGDPWLLVVAACAIALALALRRRWHLFLPWAVALGGVAGSDEAIKQFVQRPRPFGGHGFIVETGFSFPSGHAAGSMVFFGMLAWLLLRLWPPQRHRDVITAAVALIAVIGFSRVVLQVHYLSDVLAGYALGACWLVLGIALGEQLRRGQAR